MEGAFLVSLNITEMFFFFPLWKWEDSWIHQFITSNSKKDIYGMFKCDIWSCYMAYVIISITIELVLDTCRIHSPLDRVFTVRIQMINSSPKEFHLNPDHLKNTQGRLWFDLQGSTLQDPCVPRPDPTDYTEMNGVFMHIAIR